jgi:uncharacterized protein YkwD
MRFARPFAALAFALFAITVNARAGCQAVSGSRDDEPQILELDARQLLVLANQARAEAGAGPLQWDPALAAAALKHCLRMAAEGPISHRYSGEAEVTDRAGQAGAHFSIVEENIAAGSSPTDPLETHQGWMHSPGHRANLLNRDIDNVGIAVVASHGVTYSVADYARAVPVLSQAQVEAAFAALLHSRGISILRDRTDARAYCALAEGSRTPDFDPRPHYVLRWQNSDVAHLPQEFVHLLAEGGYRQAEVGSCPAQDVVGQFTAYRVAVLLY